VRLTGKATIVTGGGRSIGQTICTTMAGEGASIAVVDLNAEAAEETCGLIRTLGQQALAVKADVTDKAQVGAMVRQVLETFGRVDVLVNNVGILAIVPIVEMEEQTWDRVMTVNTKGVFLCAQAVLPIMMRQRSGKIVNMSSQAGLEGSALSSAYAASKHAVIGFTQSLAKEAGEYGITANAICPGSVDTDMLSSNYFPEKARYSGVDIEQYRRSFVERIPLKRMARAEEIAYLVAFLASDQADYITGAAITVAGGSIVH